MSLGLQTETRSIGGIEFNCTQFSCWRSYELMGQLDGLGRTVDAIMKGQSAEKVALELFLELAQMPPGQAPNVLKELLSETTAEKDGRVYELRGQEFINRVFGGDRMAPALALAFAIEVNWGPFFVAIGNALAKSRESKSAEHADPGPVADQEAPASPSIPTSKKLRRPGNSTAAGG